jgi:hypothetical protein
VVIGDSQQATLRFDQPRVAKQLNRTSRKGWSAVMNSARLTVAVMIEA